MNSVFQGGHAANRTIETGEKLSFTFQPGGGLDRIQHDGIQINSYHGNSFEPSPTNVWLRIRDGGVVRFFPLIGPESGSEVGMSHEGMKATGTVEGVGYGLSFTTDGKFTCFWDVQLQNVGGSEVTVDVVYFQDTALAGLGMADGAVYYANQYIDNTILSNQAGVRAICARQNLGQGGKHPWLISGCLQGARGCQTDGAQFLGASFKSTGRPDALIQAEPEFGRLQREFAAHILYSEWQKLAPGTTTNVTFFSKFQPDHVEPSGDDDLAHIPTEVAQVSEDAFESFDVKPTVFSTPNLFRADTMNEDELKSVFSSEWRNVERDGDRLFSFFTAVQTHVVTKAKDLAMPKIHGHIIRGGKNMYPDDRILSAVAWMPGVFGSAVAIGNPQNRFVSIARSQWNIQRASGIRMFVRTGGCWQLLAMPSAFAMDFTTCTWLYKHADGMIRVDLTASDENELKLNVAFDGKKLPALLCLEPMSAIDASIDGTTVRLTPEVDSALRNEYPNAELVATLDGEAVAARTRTAIHWELPPTESFKLIMTGKLNDAPAAQTTVPIATAVNRLPQFAANHSGQRIGEVLPWFLHNALIHLSRPAGIEQYSGGGWGTRDVSQGGVELLLSLGAKDEVKQILCNIYRHQYDYNGNWPQGFRYDKVAKQGIGSHGDIVVWPLKAVCEYIESTCDFEILDHELTYYGDDGNPTNYTEPLRDHIKRQLKQIRECMMPGTSLIAYGHGDWNDSLQPATPELAKKMVSSWTVELVYQTVMRFAEVCSRMSDDMATQMRELAAAVQSDFNKHLVVDELVAGFAIQDGDGSFEPIFHPNDKRTGIKHRLLPTTRGIISEIFDPDQAGKHVARIKEHLLAPDGARLLDRPPKYNGGKMLLFQRGETATFFGREIGLQYVHAHLRYAEAMAKLGRADDLLQALLVVTPVGLIETLPSTLPRQSNAYFSSSDAEFADRAQCEKEYNRVKTGDIQFSGGWRIYSSGGGIYIGLVQRQMLGLRRYFERFVFDPVLPASMQKMACKTHIEGTPVSINYRLKSAGYGPSKIVVNGTELTTAEEQPNPYRRGGLGVHVAELLSYFKGDGSDVIEVVG